jgi:GNAT superfamily N-acetyltransferase
VAEIVIRAAVAGDAAAVGRIWLAGWRDGHTGLVPDALVAVRTPESFLSRAADRVGDTTVAAVGGEVAGFFMLDGDEVEQVYVAAEHRGSGVAAALLAAAERAVAAAGYRTAWLAVVAGNARARRFYEKCGWRDAGAHAYAARVPGREPIPVPTRRYEKRVG